MFRRAAGLLGVMGTVLGCATSYGGTASYDFDTDPSLELQMFGNNIQPWHDTGGNDGGFLALTHAINNENAIVLFPDIDPGQIVTAFRFEADLRVGNPASGDRPADGFSISFARAQDPLLADPGNTALFAGTVPEAGTTTGIAVSFDTWAGNALPDGADIEGILVRVDNETVLRQAMPTRNGACEDDTSLQTGPRDTDYWPAGDPYLPESWETLCWQPLVVELDEQARLTVIWKGRTVLDQYQTDYFPTSGQLVLAGRTGSANEHTHIDNIQLTTTAISETEPPTAPGAVTASFAGARRVELSWEPATDDSGRVAYEVERDGVMVSSGLLVDTTLTDTGVLPGTTYTYRVRATDIAQNPSDWVELEVTTAEETTGEGFVLGEIWDGVTGTSASDFLFVQPDILEAPDRTVYINGLSFGETTGFGDTFGDNYGIRITGTLTVPETGEYDFFVRSDDASQFFLRLDGPQPPDPNFVFPIAEELECCAAFQEPGILNGDGLTSSTTLTPVSLTAGEQYGFMFVVKEGGGGDWGQVAMRMVGDPTPAAELEPIRGPLVMGASDPTGAEVTIISAPEDQTVTENESVTFMAEATHVSPYGAPIVYQWLRDGTVILGATGTSYTIPVVTAAENNAEFSVWVGTLGANTTTAAATLTVEDDDLSPTITSVTMSDDTFQSLDIRFSEPVTSPTAEDAANYTIGGGIDVTGAERVDEFTIRLSTSEMAVGTEYTLSVANVEDNAGNMADTSSAFTTWDFVPNRVKISRYHDIGGTPIQGLYDDPDFPGNPDFVHYLTGLTFNQPTGAYGENYGALLQGYLIPEEDGEYHFFIRADDTARLYLSEDETLPDPKVDTPIAAEEAGCCEGFKEPDGTAQPFETTTTPISLTAGERYGIVFVVKEATGGDWGQVAMRMVGDDTPAGSLQPISDQVYYFGPAGGGEPPVGPTIAISREGGSITISYEGTLESASDVTGPYEPVAGATNPYTVEATDGMQFYRAAE